MKRALLLRLEHGRETDLNHQGRKESNNEGQDGINPNPDHADLVGEEVPACFSGGRDRHRALTLDPAADDFDGSSDTMNLSLSDGGLTRLVKSFSLLAGGIDFRANAIDGLRHGRKLFVELFVFGLFLFGQGGHGG